jgi:hypothetical protein
LAGNGLPFKENQFIPPFGMKGFWHWQHMTLEPFISRNGIYFSEDVLDMLILTFKLFE